MNDATGLNIQAIELRGLLERADQDPILGPQLRDRLNEVEEEIRGLPRAGAELFPEEARPISRAAFFVSGSPVSTSGGIPPGLAGELLVQYERMFTQQALHDERESAKDAGRQRRRRGSEKPTLWLIGTPHGSFGFEFTPKTADDSTLDEVHGGSLQRLADNIARIVESGDTRLDQTLQDLPARMLQPLKKFLVVLAENGAELRLASSSAPARSFSLVNIHSAADRLRTGIVEEELTLAGTFRGLTHDTYVFDFRSDAGELISGSISDSLFEEDLERMDRLINLPCTAALTKTTVQGVSVPTRLTYVLLNLLPREDAIPVVKNPASPREPH